MAGKQIKELLAMMLIGDGILAVLCPREHALLWDVGPRFMRGMVHAMVGHPIMTQMCGVAEFGAGLWLAYRQYPESRSGARHEARHSQDVLNAYLTNSNSAESRELLSTIRRVPRTY